MLPYLSYDNVLIHVSYLIEYPNCVQPVGCLYFNLLNGFEGEKKNNGKDDLRTCKGGKGLGS